MAEFRVLFPYVGTCEGDSEGAQEVEERRARTRAKDNEDAGELRCIENGLKCTPVIEIEDITRRVCRAHYRNRILAQWQILEWNQLYYECRC